MSDAVRPMDFAISYAGENFSIAKEVATRLRELGYEVFLAGDVRHLLASADGERFFERLFTEAKEVVAFISEHYVRKEWTRYEWDVIRDRDRVQRFIAVRLDNSPILGLSSNIFYVPFDGKNYDEIVKVCVSRLLAFEHENGESRMGEYERIFAAIRNESSGATAQAYQLVRDQRKRDPLGDVSIPDCDEIRYEVVESAWHDSAVVRRRSIRITVPAGMSHSDLRCNMMHCASTQFNAFKPDAVIVLAYKAGDQTDGAYTAGRMVFAPFGRWDKAQDGFAYNIPVTEFQFTLDVSPHYS